MSDNSVTTTTSSNVVTDFHYDGEDLESMNFSDKYHNWVLNYFDNYIGNSLLEVGAGTGSFAKLLMERYQKNVWLLEPSAAMVKKLKANLADQKHFNINHVFHGFLSQHKQALTKAQIDSVFYINVLEHILDDVQELKDAYDVLVPGGYIFTFSPALPQLYGAFDKSVDHQRRYYLQEMKDKMTAAGFEVVQAHYFDFIGMILWFIKYKILKSDKLEPGAVKLFDTFIVPFSSTFEPSRLLPVGKNILVIGKKPA